MLTGLKGLVRSLAELGSEDSDLDLAELTARRRNAQEEILTDKLSAVKYEIDSKDSIKLFGSGRIENVSRLSSALVLNNNMNARSVLASSTLPCYQEAFTNHETRQDSHSGG
jgi:hypothetical protein